jgi:indoleacetamide hydrolase
MDDTTLTLEALAQAMRTRALTCSGYTRHLLDQERRWAALNSIVSLDPDQVMAMARARDEELIAGKSRGSLHGIAFVVKDNIDTSALPTTACTPALRTHRPQKNAPVVDSLLHAGAMVLAKANMHELAFGITNNNGAFGAARNPYDPTLIAGGSSGGTAAAVAAGIAPFGLGTDTGGSVRIPAALCGLVGFRPTAGRYSPDGVVPISSTKDTVGPMAHTVADIDLIDAVLTHARGPVAAAVTTRLRIGVPRGYFYEDLDRDVESAVEAFLSELRAAGAELVEKDIADIGELNDAVSRVVVNYEARPSLERYLADTAAGVTFEDLLDAIVSPDVKAIYSALARGVTEARYRRAMDVDRPALQARLLEYLSANRLDAYVVPTTALTARRIGDDEVVELNGRQVPTFATYIRNCDPSSSAGFPSITIPIASSTGRLPVGLTIEAAPSHDRRLLGVAKALEAVRRSRT